MSAATSIRVGPFMPISSNSTYSCFAFVSTSDRQLSDDIGRLELVLALCCHSAYSDRICAVKARHLTCSSDPGNASMDG